MSSCKKCRELVASGRADGLVKAKVTHYYYQLQQLQTWVALPIADNRTFSNLLHQTLPCSHFICSFHFSILRSSQQKLFCVRRVTSSSTLSPDQFQPHILWHILSLSQLSIIRPQNWIVEAFLSISKSSERAKAKKFAKVCLRSS